MDWIAGLLVGIALVMLFAGVTIMYALLASAVIGARRRRPGAKRSMTEKLADDMAELRRRVSEHDERRGR